MVELELAALRLEADNSLSMVDKNFHACRDTQLNRHALMLLMRQGHSYFQHFLNKASTPAADLLELVLNEPRVRYILKLKHPPDSHGLAEGRREGFEHTTREHRTGF